MFAPYSSTMPAADIDGHTYPAVHSHPADKSAAAWIGDDRAILAVTLEAPGRYLFGLYPEHAYDEQEGCHLGAYHWVAPTADDFRTFVGFSPEGVDHEEWILQRARDEYGPEEVTFHAF